MTGSQHITNYHAAAFQGQHALVCGCSGWTGSLFTGELHFTRNCQQTSRRSMLLFGNMWCGLRKTTVMSWVN